MTHTSAPPELWGGIECTVNRVGARWFDQIERSGHATRLDDLHRFASLGLRTLRYPVLWERIAPDADVAPDWTWPDRRLDTLRALGIRPIVGLLHHGSGPGYTSLVDPSFPQRLAAFARAVAARYPWITDWTPINEPLTTARFSGLYGHWFPHARSDKAYLRMLVNQLQATVLAMREVRRIRPEARLVQTEDLGAPFGTPGMAVQLAHEEQRRWLTWDLLAGAVDDAHPLREFLDRGGVTPRDLAWFREHPCPADVIGLNYYLTSDRWLDERLNAYPAATHGSNGWMQYADVEAVRARPEGIAGHEALLTAAWERYRRPVAITEVHLGCTREDQVRWLVEAWRAAGRAKARGVDVRGVTAWALLGSFDWDSLVTRETGHYEPGAFDVRGPTPRPTALAHAVAALASGRDPDDDVVARPGWWRRHRPAATGDDVREGNAGRPVRPVLIVGARGTLGRACQRIAQQRGVAAEVTARSALDICDAAAVEAVLDRLDPWAVVNAAGYVRVDEAERARGACWCDNVTGAETLAAACARRRLPLVTFSSDLVFDGRAARPYVEGDRPNPLNVYGVSKAEAERRVLARWPDALVVRTSAFFGPWDEHNFATQLLRALAEGRPFAADARQVVTPTYVPDLVHATFDLLADRAHGIWHLANPDPVSWTEFGRALAIGSGLDPELVRALDAVRPAARPAYSALASERGRLMRPLADAIADFIEQVVLPQPAQA